MICDNVICDDLTYTAGNGGSLDKCRRRWDLADAEQLKYKFMQVHFTPYAPLQPTPLPPAPPPPTLPAIAAGG